MRPLVALLLAVAVALPLQSGAARGQSTTPALSAIASQLDQLLATNQTQAALLFDDILTKIVKLLPTVNPLTVAGANQANVLATMFDQEVDAFDLATGNVLGNVLFVLNNSVGSGSTTDAELAQQLASALIGGLAASPAASGDFASALADLYGAAPAGS